MEAIITLLSLPIIILNFGGGIVGGIWLLIRGKWSLVIYTIIIGAIGGSWILSLILLPTLLLMPLIMRYLERGKSFLAYIFTAISYIYTYVVMTVWCVGAFVMILNNYESGSILPYMLLAYSLATGPWTYMASQENRSSNDGNSLGSTIPAFFSCIGAAIMMLIVFFGDPTIHNLAIGFGVTVFIAFILQSFIFVGIARAYKKVEV